MKHTQRLLSLLLLALAGPAQAEDQGPALRGLERLQERFGAEAFLYIFEMTGVGGDPQPSTWRVTARDLGRSNVLHEYWIGERRVTDEGLNDDYYPDRLPKGFFKLSRVKLDSTQAFAIAEQVARDAGSGFDSVNYKLHGREYTSEPVWTLTLLDKEEEIVGSVHLSADSGEVLRTVWMRRKRNGRLVILDSALSEEPSDLASPPAEKKAESETAGVPADPPPPPPTEPTPAPAPPAGNPRTDKASDDEEIPEIKRLNEAQEKTREAPKKP
jgi:hypothetical protein